MFKSVFAKYVTAFMTIITFGFAILLLVVTSIVSHYAAQAKIELLDHVAQVMGESIAIEGREQSPEDFFQVLSGDFKLSLDRTFSAFATGDNDKMSAWLADRDGTILYTIVANEERPAIGNQKKIPEEILVQIEDGQDYMDTVDTENGVVLMRVLGIHNAKGELCGVIAVCSSNVRWGTMLEEVSKTVIASALLVMLAALVAAYFITERTVRPLQEMRSVAKSMASGNFETRVRVHGQDEVAELSIAFNQMADSLQNLENMRNSFIANVSHDLRTPMTTIAGFIDGIRDGVIPEEDRAHYLDVISMEVQRLSRLVTSLLDLSRLQAGDRKLKMKDFDICEMARLILISFEKKIDEKHLDVEFSCEEDRMSVHADRDAIYQVFYNICHNAVKFAREYGKLRIQIGLTKEKKLCVSVYNQGQGIPAEDIPLIFERFYKSDKSRGLDKNGVGLGLFISKTIITAHGERIWVESREGEDCQFFFTLPKGAGLHFHGNAD